MSIEVSNLFKVVSEQEWQLMIKLLAHFVLFSISIFKPHVNFTIIPFLECIVGQASRVLENLVCIEPTQFLFLDQVATVFFETPPHTPIQSTLLYVLKIVEKHS